MTIRRFNFLLAFVCALFHGATTYGQSISAGPAEIAAPKPTEYTSAQLDAGFYEGRAWSDFNGDGKADYCRVVDNNGTNGKLRCTLSTGAGFAKEITSGQLDAGRHEGRAWTDFDGDGKADYCRVVGANGDGGHLRCTLSTGTGFGSEVTSFKLDAGFFEGRAWADFNNDGKSDFFRVVETNGNKGRIKVTLSKGDRFGIEITSPELNLEYWEGRSASDLDGDGNSDYCWVHKANSGTGRVSCAPSLGDDFGPVFTSLDIDVGYYEGRAWPRVFGPGQGSYCRIVGGPKARCLKAEDRGFGGEIESSKIDAGYHEGRAWPDYDGDGNDDYCRVVGNNNGTDGRVACTRSTGTAFGTTHDWGPLEAGFYEGRAWPDFDGDGKAEYCRVIVNNGSNGKVRCTLLR